MTTATRVVMEVCAQCGREFPRRRSWVPQAYCGRRCVGLSSAAKRAAVENEGERHRQRLRERLSGLTKMDAFLTGVRIGYWRADRELAAKTADARSSPTDSKN